MAKLVLSSEGSVLYQCFVDKERLTLGSGPWNRVVIEDPAVRAEHAAIVPVGNDHILEDLQTGSATVVNGTRVTRHILQHGDVIQFGAHFLRYLNPRAAAERDFERTMFIAGLRAEAESAGSEVPPGVAQVPYARSAASRFPRGKVRLLAGGGAGGTVALERVVTTFGKAEGDLAVIARRPHGFFVTHVSGRQGTRVNGEPIGDQTRALAVGDVIEVADQRLQFLPD
jgi:pSer/pThr/pTyr-binding forkhead associated (FHA) protein